MKKRMLVELEITTTDELYVLRWVRSCKYVKSAYRLVKK
jgi:hypothetical protein